MARKIKELKEKEIKEIGELLDEKENANVICKKYDITKLTLQRIDYNRLREGKEIPGMKAEGGPREPNPVVWSEKGVILTPEFLDFYHEEVKKVTEEYTDKKGTKKNRVIALEIYDSKKKSSKPVFTIQKGDKFNVEMNADKGKCVFALVLTK